MAGDLRSQTLRNCPHCRGDFLINEAGDGSISVEMVTAETMPPPKDEFGGGLHLDDEDETTRADSENKEKVDAISQLNR